MPEISRKFQISLRARRAADHFAARRGNPRARQLEDSLPDALFQSRWQCAERPLLSYTKDGQNLRTTTALNQKQ
jgi:hypothetical protein